MDALQPLGFSSPQPVLDGAALGEVDALLSQLPADDAGTRELLEFAWCRALARDLRQSLLASQTVEGGGHAAVQCTLFRKSATCNWKVTLHQDLSVPVADRVDHPVLAGWSRKQGRWFVQPPVALLENMLAVRVHLDDCGDDDGPLRVVPGSHRHGRVDGRQARRLREQYGEHVCRLRAGQAMAMRPLLLHASSKATQPKHGRRVLQFLFGPAEPGLGLEWSQAC